MYLSRILAIETSQAYCSVALLSPQSYDYACDDQVRNHSKSVLPMIDQLLKKNNLSIRQLDAIAFSRGPGSFTGLRIGAAVVQGLAFAHGLKIVAVSSLHLMALAALRKYPCVERIICCVDARLNGVYWAEFSVHKNASKEPNGIKTVQSICTDQLSSAPYTQIIEKSHLENTLFVGDALPLVFASTDRKCSIIQQDESIRPNAQELVYFARDYDPAQMLEAQQLELSYLGGTDAWKKLAEQ